MRACSLLWPALRTHYLRPLISAVYRHEWDVRSKWGHGCAFCSTVASRSEEVLPDRLRHRRPSYQQASPALQPKQIFSDYYNVVQTHFVDGEKLKPVMKFASKKGKHLQWTATCRIAWPGPFEATGTGATKKHAEAMAISQVLSHLQATNKIKDGKPVFFSEDEARHASNLIKQPSQLTIPAGVAEKIAGIYDEHKFLRRSLEPWMDAKYEFREEFEDDVPFSEEWTSEKLAKRREELKRKLHFRERADKNLPILQFRDKIVGAVRNNGVIVLSGDTGCGKSTQVPQLILDDLIGRGHGTDANVIVAQPRRISAIALARRIAEERGETVGETVGYQVRLEAVMPKCNKGSVLLCTGGILLRRIIGNPTLEGVSHVILDEAHERDITTDVLMVFLRRALRENPNLKVVVMSATINVDMFSRYFDNAPVVEVPGRLYPVEVTYLDGLISELYQRRKMPREVHALATAEPRNSDSSRRERSLLSSELTARTVAYIHETCAPGAVLVFLPGWQEIKAVMEDLDEERLKNVLVVPVHSKLSTKEQGKIFSKPPPGVRKVVLATNIAETSITIDDVRYVVDTGYHRQNVYDPTSGVEFLETSWISKANANQRKGRAGRVASGECFRLYPKRVFDQFEPFQRPEMLRSALERVVLDVKALASPGEKVAQFFDEALESPDKANVERALSDLRDDGFLDDEECLTALGRVLTPCPTHPKLAKALAYAALFRCVGTVTDIVAALSAPRDILVGNVDTRKDNRALKRKYHAKSDHLAVQGILEDCREVSSRRQLVQYCWDNMMHFPTVRFVLELASSFGDYLRGTGLFRDSEDLANDGHDDLVLAALAAGFGSSKLLRVKHGELSRGFVDPSAISLKTESRRRAVVGSDSVFAGSKSERSVDMTTLCLMGFVQMESLERQARLLRELSQISPLAPLLVCDSDLLVSELDDDVFTITFRKSQVVRVACDRRTAEAVQDLREVVKFLAAVFVTRGAGRWDLVADLEGRLERHRDDVIHVLADVLEKHSVVNPVSEISSSSRTVAE